MFRRKQTFGPVNCFEHIQSLYMETNEFRSLDNDKININEYFEVEYWSKQFELKPDVFKNLVKEAGTDSIKALREYLNKNYRGNAA